MIFVKTFLTITVLIFGITISIAFLSRAICEANELCYEPVCDNSAIIYMIFSERPAQNEIKYNKHDEEIVFESAASYFLERYENSPPY